MRGPQPQPRRPSKSAHKHHRRRLARAAIQAAARLVLQSARPPRTPGDTSRRLGAPNRRTVRRGGPRAAVPCDSPAGSLPAAHAPEDRSSPPDCWAEAARASTESRIALAVDRAVVDRGLLAASARPSLGAPGPDPAPLSDPERLDLQARLVHSERKFAGASLQLDVQAQALQSALVRLAALDGQAAPPAPPTVAPHPLVPVAGPEPLARFAAGTFCQSALDAANRRIVDLRHSLGDRAPPSPAPAASLPRPPAPFVFAARACPPPPWAAAAPARLVVSLGTAPAFPAGTVLPAPPGSLAPLGRINNRRRFCRLRERCRRGWYRRRCRQRRCHRCLC